MEQNSASPKSLEGEAKINQLRQEVTRLKFDTWMGTIPEIRFDSDTGEDLRNNPEKMLQVQKSMLLPEAEDQMSNALGYRSKDQFSKVTGAPLSKLEFEKPINGFDELMQAPYTPESLQARINVFRQDIGVKVAKAKERGVEIPKFDSQTGEEIPQDSLRALRELEKAEKPKTGHPDRILNEGDMADIDDALEIYRKWKGLKKSLG